MGDIVSHPTAARSDPNWRMMYVSIGDAAMGETGDPAIRPGPQMLSAFGGKVIRIRPDNIDMTIPSTLSPNGKYYIPNDDPFTTIADSSVRDEIYALGLRNLHRMIWDVDPENPENNYLIVNDIGLHTLEEVNIIHAGGNYGYSSREGNEQPSSNAVTAPVPTPDRVPVYRSNISSGDTVPPLYPVAQYGHGRAGQGGPAGDAITSGFVYRGSNIPTMYGKYIFERYHHGTGHVVRLRGDACCRRWRSKYPRYYLLV